MAVKTVPCVRYHKISDLNKLQHVQHQFVVSKSTLKAFDGKLADCKIGVCTVKKLER